MGAYQAIQAENIYLTRFLKLLVCRNKMSRVTIINVLVCFCIFVFADGQEDCRNITNPIMDVKQKILCNYNKDDVPKKRVMQITMQIIPKYIEYVSLLHCIVFNRISSGSTETRNRRETRAFFTLMRSGGLTCKGYGEGRLWLP